MKPVKLYAKCWTFGWATYEWEQNKHVCQCIMAWKTAEKLLELELIADSDNDNVKSGLCRHAVLLNSQISALAKSKWMHLCNEKMR